MASDEQCHRLCIDLKFHSSLNGHIDCAFLEALAIIYTSSNGYATAKYTAEVTHETLRSLGMCDQLNVRAQYFIEVLPLCIADRIPSRVY